MAIPETVLDFNTHLKMFVDQMASRFPERDEMALCKMYVGSQLSSRLMADNFRSKVVRYRGMCYDRDEEFLDKVSAAFAHNIKLGLHDMWGQIDEDERESIWAWLDVLVMDAEKIG
jgi:hypothetical protein